MELILAIILGFCIAGIGFFIGTAAAGHEVTRLSKVNGELQTKINSIDPTAPMVIECQLGQPLTVEQMSMEVVAPNLIKIWRHFGKDRDTLPSMTKYAEEMHQWYNPDSLYTKLVIAGYLRDDVVRIAWTWQKQEPKFIVTRDAVECLEKYYEDVLGNPMAIYNQKD